MQNCQSLIVIVGPTSSGKTNLALRLASEIDGEIISSDSRQIYRKMDIGTGKPSPEELSTVNHHLINIVDPDEEYGLFLFLSQAKAAMREILSRAKIPILAGGTGQYVWGLLEGWNVPEVPPDPEFRKLLEDKIDTEGTEGLYQELAASNPIAASRLDSKNGRRLIRALEILKAYPSSLPQPTKTPPGFRFIIVGLTLENGLLYKRIDKRVDSMIAMGWLSEVRNLLDLGYSANLASMSGLGYGELTNHLFHKSTLDEAVLKTKLKTKKLAQRQYSWFRINDERIRWFESTQSGLDLAISYVNERIVECETIQ